MRIVFMGTPEFAVPCLRQLVEDGHEIPLVITQADRPKGRGYVLTPPPVKAFALTQGLPVYQPETWKNNAEALERLRDCRANVAIVVAYGRILPQAALDIPTHGCINVHASLLPRYRGAAPIAWAILNGETETGVSTMLLDAGMDTGDRLLERRVPIPTTMTAGELQVLLSEEGAHVMADTLTALQARTLVRHPQDNDQATYAPMLSRELSPLDWTQTAHVLHNQVRGLNPWPSAHTTIDGKKLKVHTSQVGEGTAEEPGTIVKLNPFTVACGAHTSLVLCEVQYEGARRLPASDFLRGHPLKTGQLLPN